MLATLADDLTGARTSFDAAEHGDFGGFDDLSARLRTGDSAESRAWDIALRAVRGSFDPLWQGPPTLADARQLAFQAPSVAPILARACAAMERMAVRTFDRAELSGWIALHASLPPIDLGPGALNLFVARLWDLLFAGKTEGLDAQAKLAFDEAARCQAGVEAAEATVLRALVALSAGALNDATALARRASRLAGSQAGLQEDCLASIVLARVHRYTGQTHLALHGLTALARIAPRSWWGWLGWETLLAGGPRPRAQEMTGARFDPTPSLVAERALGDVIEAARAGERAPFDAAATRLTTAAAVWPQLAQEAAALLAALDPAGRSGPNAMAAWQRGDVALIPFGLQGAAISEAPAGQDGPATAYVLAQPDQPARRFFLPGLPLLRGARVLATAAPRSGALTETAIAALALSGETVIPRDTFFRRVYGFRFVGHRHRAEVDVLCHRMRLLVGGSGKIQRHGHEAPGARSSSSAAASSVPALTLTLCESIAVADGRCVLSVADRVLRALAIDGASRAKDLAKTLSIPLRSLQAVLQRLVSEGACSVERDGRHIYYRIEDFTLTLETCS